MREIRERKSKESLIMKKWIVTLKSESTKKRILIMRTIVIVIMVMIMLLMIWLKLLK